MNPLLRLPLWLLLAAVLAPGAHGATERGLVTTRGIFGMEAVPLPPEALEAPSLRREQETDEPADDAPPRARRISVFDSAVLDPESDESADVQFRNRLLGRRFRLALEKGRAGDYQSAVDLYLILFETEAAPMDFKAFVCNNLGVFYHRLGQIEECEAWLHRSLELKPGNKAASLSLSALFLNRNQCRDARDLLTPLTLRFADEWEDSFVLFFNLACAHICLGELEDALLKLHLAGLADPVRTFSNLGDPQLDPLRDAPSFQRLQTIIEEDFENGIPTESPDENPIGAPIPLPDHL